MAACMMRGSLAPVLVVSMLLLAGCGSGGNRGTAWTGSEGEGEGASEGEGEGASEGEGEGASEGNGEGAGTGEGEGEGGEPFATYWAPRTPNCSGNLVVYSAFPGKVHWGVNNWQTPPRNHWPSGTVQPPGDTAVETPLQGPNPAGEYTRSFGPFGDTDVLVETFEFVILRQDGIWDNNAGRNYIAEIRGDCRDPAEGEGEGTAEGEGEGVTEGEGSVGEGEGEGPVGEGEGEGSVGEGEGEGSVGEGEGEGDLGVTWDPELPNCADSFVISNDSPGFVHWAVNDWASPIANYWPSGSIPYEDGVAVETPLVGPDEEERYQADFGPFQGGHQRVVSFNFVIHRLDGSWDNNSGADYRIMIGGDCSGGLDPVCGDGILEKGEACEPSLMPQHLDCSSVDRRYMLGEIGCTIDCKISLENCVLSGVCGNGVIDDGEACDDGNTRDHDGCSANCFLEGTFGQGGVSCGSAERDSFGMMTAVPDPFCDIAANRNGFVRPAVRIDIRVRLHVVRSSAGILSASDQDTNALLSQANAVLSQAGLGLIKDGPTDVVADPQNIYFNLNNATRPSLIATNDSANALDAYVVNTYGNLAGRANDIGPSNTVDGVVVIAGVDGAVLAHEVGHALGLFHTFQPLVGNNCDTSYDLCCDTPFDPGDPVCVDNPAGQCSVVCSDGSTPDGNNVMSYYQCAYDSTQARLTPQQVSRALCYVQRNYQYAVAASCSDSDGDGYGTTATVACANAGIDCDDTNAAIHPNAVELCDAVDNNCDGNIDENGEEECGSDVGECKKGRRSCVVGQWGECVGEVTAVRETCNNKDDDCDGATDNNIDPLQEPIAERCPRAGLCANGAARDVCTGGVWTCVFPPGYTPVECPVRTAGGQACGSGSLLDQGCRDRIDNDCDGVTDENNPILQCAQDPNYGRVQRGDICFSSPFGRCGVNGGTYECVQLAENCGVRVDCMGATFSEPERCDGQDWDCDAYADNRSDFDHDGFGDCPGKLDCNESNPSIHPGAVEICDGQDNNCDGSVDEGLTTRYYRDADGDGFGNPASSTLACQQPAGYSNNTGDCDDGNPGLHLGSTVCSGRSVLECSQQGVLSTTACEYECQAGSCISPGAGLYVRINVTRLNSFIEFKGESNRKGEQATGHIVSLGESNYQWALENPAANNNVWYWWNTLDGTANISIWFNGTHLFKGTCTHAGFGEQNVRGTATSTAVYRTAGQFRLEERGVETHVLP